MSKKTKQRLAIFLDGTWNTEDDTSNVLNAYHSTKEGSLTEGEDMVIQKRYYDRGVGTSLFDNVRGGGYGLGLDKNLREAYHWLVDQYDDDFENEIYIFGFSRGAYTARSLVGLIAACGLIKKNAPMTITQLWNAYAFISKNRRLDHDAEWWEKQMKKESNKHLFERLSAIEKRKDCPYNEAEELILSWSRRVKITYLGIYDTVGALGIHALGIPGLKSKLDANHNLSPTSLIQSCRHALAIDEHRPSFRLTTFRNFVENKSTDYLDQYNGPKENKKSNIEQEWFVGAHSNIGGGYENNVSMIRPFQWIMEGVNNGITTSLGILQNPHGPNDLPSHTPNINNIRDSFREFLGFFYAHIIREKRNFRTINEAEEVRSGYTLRPINESIHDSVNEFAINNHGYAPPNVLSFLNRYKSPKSPLSEDKISAKSAPNPFKNRKTQLSWPGDSFSYSKKKPSSLKVLKAKAWLAFWSITAAFGLIQLASFFWIEDIAVTSLNLSILAFLFVLIDWLDHKLTFGVMYNPKAVRLKIYWNIIYWMRFVGVLSFFVGAICIITALIFMEYNLRLDWQGIASYIKISIAQWPASLGWALGIVTGVFLLLSLFNKWHPHVSHDQVTIDPKHLKPIPKETSKNQGWLAFFRQTSVLLVGLTPIVISLATVIILIVNNFKSIYLPVTASKQAIGFLLMIILLPTLAILFRWVGKPMGPDKANIGNILTLHFATSKAKVEEVFNQWLDPFVRIWDSAEDDRLFHFHGATQMIQAKQNEKRKAIAWIHLRNVLRISIWRDIIGLVPLYSIILGLPLWMASLLWCGDLANVPFLGCCPWWLGLILFTAICDMIENIIHLSHIENYPKGKINNLAVRIGNFFTFTKLLGFFTQLFLAIATFLYLVYCTFFIAGDMQSMFVNFIILVLIICFGFYIKLRFSKK